MAATTIEQTGKWFKGWKLVAIVMAAVGVFVFTTPHPRLGLFLFAGGVLLFVIMSIASWWNHG